MQDFVGESLFLFVDECDDILETLRCAHERLDWKIITFRVTECVTYSIDFLFRLFECASQSREGAPCVRFRR